MALNYIDNSSQIVFVWAFVCGAMQKPQVNEKREIVSKEQYYS